MDLVAGVKNIIICTTHVTKNGKPKLLKKCNLPLTGQRVVKKIITDMAVFEVKPDGSGLLLKELEKGITVEDLKKVTEAAFTVDSNLIQMPHAPYNQTYTSHLVPGGATLAAHVDHHTSAPNDPHTTSEAEDEKADLKTLFGKLKNHKDYSMLKNALKGSFGSMVLPTVLPLIAKQSPALAKAIKANKAEFLKMINDDHDDDHKKSKI